MSLSEFTLIEELFKKKATFSHPQTTVVNGDDASAHQLTKGCELIVSTDTSVAGVHWPHDFPLEKAADRAVCSALSDLAAMGAQACWAWVSVMSSSQHHLAEMGQGVGDALNRYHVELAGGDTVSSPVNALNVTVAGQLPIGSSMCRSGAIDSDALWLLGKVGFSSLGLRQWMGGKHDGYFVQYFKSITPKLEHGFRLRELGVHCCIDISDGLLQDASHIAKASGVGIQIEISHVPGWDVLNRKAGEKDAVQAVLSGGEDYALLFTAPKESGWLKSFATCIGTCKKDLAVGVLLHGNEMNADVSGFDHFA